MSEYRLRSFGSLADQFSSACCRVGAADTAITARDRSLDTTSSLPSRVPSLSVASFTAFSSRFRVQRADDHRPPR